MRVVVKLALAFVGVLVVIIGGGIAYLSLLDLDRYRDQIADAVRAATGRELTIAGKLELHLGIPVELSATELRLANAPWGSQPDMAVLDRAEIAVAILPLVRGVLAIDSVTLDGLDLLLETNASGEGNWQFSSAQATQTESAPQAGANVSSAGGGSPFGLGNTDAVVTRSRAKWRSGETGEIATFAIDRLALLSEGAGAPVAVELAATFNGAPISMKGRVGPLADLISVKAPYSVALMAETPGLSVSTDGTVADPLGGEGIDLPVSVNAADIAGAAKAMALTLPVLPPFTAEGRLTDERHGYRLADLKIAAEMGDIAGDVRIALDPTRPSLTVRLSGSRLDLRQVGLDESERDDGGGSSPLPFEALVVADADVHLDIATIELPKIAMHNVAVATSLTNGRLNATMNVGWLGGGSGTVSLDADAHNQSAAARLTTHNVDLGTVLGAVGVAVLEGGPTDAVIDLSGRGQTGDNWLASAAGNVDLRIGPAVARNRVIGLIGGDLVTNLINTVNPFSRTDNVSRIRCGVVRAPVAKGRLTFDRSLAVETDKLGIIASGSIDVPRERLDLAVRTQAREGLGVSLASVATLFVGIGGTFDRPTVQATPLSGVLDIGRFALNIAGSVATLDVSELTRLLFTRSDMCKTATGGTASQASGGGLGAKAATAAEGAATAAGQVLSRGRRSLERLFGD